MDLSSEVSHASLSPYWHSLHVLLSFFLLIFIVLFITHSRFTTGSHPPVILSSPYPQCLPIPPSSVAQFLDSLETSFLCQSSMTRNGLRFPRYTNFLFSVLHSLTPPGYSFINSSRLHGKGGGLALIFKSCLKIKTVSIPLFSSFEALCVRLTMASSSYTILTIYRPPSYSKKLFSTEF